MTIAVSKVLHEKFNQRSSGTAGGGIRHMLVLRSLRLARRRAGGGGRVRSAEHSMYLNAIRCPKRWGIAYGTESDYTRDSSQLTKPATRKWSTLCCQRSWSDRSKRR